MGINRHDTTTNYLLDYPSTYRTGEGRMSIFGKLLKEVVGGVIDTVEVTGAVASDIVKSPIRLINKALDAPDEETPEFFSDTKRKLDEI